MAWTLTTVSTAGGSYAGCNSAKFLPMPNLSDCFAITRDNFNNYYGGAGNWPAFGPSNTAWFDPDLSAVVPQPGAFAVPLVGAGGSQVVTFGEPFNLSPADGLLVASAICAIWAAAFAWRSLRHVLDHTGGDD